MSTEYNRRLSPQIAIKSVNGFHVTAHFTFCYLLTLASHSRENTKPFIEPHSGSENCGKGVSRQTKTDKIRFHNSFIPRWVKHGAAHLSFRKPLFSTWRGLKVAFTYSFWRLANLVVFNKNSNYRGLLPSRDKETKGSKNITWGVGWGVGGGGREID